MTDSPASGGTWSAHGRPLALWTAAWLVFFAALLLGQARLPNGDFSGQFHAFSLLQARVIAAGELPLWSPGSFAGFPFAADPQAAVFYPPRWITIWLTLPWGFSYYALTLEGLLHVWLAGIFTYLLAWDITGRRSPALFSAIAFALGGYLVAYPIQQLAILETIIWLPLILLLLRRAAVNGFRPGSLLAAGLVLGLAALAGHPQTLLHAGYLSAAYYLYLTRRAGWPWLSILGRGGLLAVVAILAAAAALLPAARYVAETTRSGVDYAFVSTGFPLIDYWQMVVPGTLTLWSPQYVGLVAVVLAGLAWFGRRAGPERREIVFWSAAALVAAWLSLGDNGILFELVHRMAPGFSLFRQQERLVGVFSLSMALLAGQGLALWLQGVEARRFGDSDRRSLFWPVGLVAGLLVLAGGTLLAARNIATDGWWWIWLRQAAILAAVGLLVWRLRGRPRLAVGGLLALLFIDLLLATRPTMGLVAESPAVFWPQPAWLQTLRDDQPGRLDSQNVFLANVGEIYDLADIRGISPLKPAVVEQYEALPRRLRWQLLNVTHVIAPEPLEAGMTAVAPVDESILPGEMVSATLYRFDDALPRAWLVDEPLFAADAAAALELIRAPEFDPVRQVALLVEDAPRVPAPAPAAGSVEIVVSPHGELWLGVTTANPAILVISEWYRPGWRAVLDGDESIPLMNANGGLMAVVVPAGQHGLHLRYQPVEIPIGIAISVVTLAAAALLAWRWRPVVVVRGETAAVSQAASPLWAIKSTRPGRAWRWLLVLLLLLTFGLRTFRLGHQELRGDEAFSYNFSQLPLAQVIPEMIAQGDPHPPLHYLGLNLWTDLAGVSEFALRYVSVLAGVLLVAVVYVLGRQMAGWRAGLLAMALAAASPGLIWLSQDVRNQYTLVPLYTALATLVLVTPLRRGGLKWGLYGFLCVLTVFTHYYGVFALAAHGLFLGLAPERRRDLAGWVGCGVVTALALGGWLLASSQGVVQAGHLYDPGNPELARHLTTVGRELIIGPALGHPFDRWLVVGGATLVIVGGLALLRARRPNWAAMLLAWLLVGAYGMFLVRFTRGTFNSYYSTVLAPPWWLLLAAGGMWLWTKGRWPRAGVTLAAAVWGMAVVVALANYYVDPHYSRTIGYRPAAAHLTAAAGADDLFIVPYPDPVWDYYLRDSELPRTMLPSAFAETAAATEAALLTLSNTHERFWFVPYTGWDRENTVGRWLDYHTLREEIRTLERKELRAYRPLPAAAAMMRPIGQTTDEGLELSAVHVTVDGLAIDPAQDNVSIRPGALVEVTLLWAAAGPTDRPYTVFVHLLDNSGALISQHDGIPAEGTRPTTTLLPGERLLDLHGLVVPEGFGGPVRLVAGLYDSETVERQIFNDGAETISLGSLIVESPE